MNIVQAVEHPFGINVFGSAIIRVEPDIGSLTFSVSRLHQNPRDAFRAAHEGAQSVEAFLTQEKISDVGSSRVTLEETFGVKLGASHFIGYTAKVHFNILLHDLNRTEDILVGIVGAGANNVASLSPQTTQLKEIRAEARQRAVIAAREKAENYCKAAGINLGPVIHIEDVNPEKISFQSGHLSTKDTAHDDEGGLRAFNPGSITVAGAVMMAFEIGR